MAALSAPLTKFTRKNAPLLWFAKFKPHFELVKKGLISAPLLMLPSGTGGFVIFHRCVWGQVGLCYDTR